MNFKKILICTAAVVTCLSYTGCGSDSSTNSTNNNTAQSSAAETAAPTEAPTEPPTEPNPIDSLTALEKEIFDNFLIGVDRFENREKVRFTEINSKIYTIGDEPGNGECIYCGLNVEHSSDNLNSMNALFGIKISGSGRTGNEYSLYLSDWVNEDRYSARKGDIDATGMDFSGSSDAEMVSHLNNALKYHWEEMGLL